LISFLSIFLLSGSSTIREEYSMDSLIGEEIERGKRMLLWFGIGWVVGRGPSILLGLHFVETSRSG
jgi:hypothetical protein